MYAKVLQHILKSDISLRCLAHLLSPCFPFMSDGDKDEGEDMASDLRRTESDSVLKKVSISTTSFSQL